MSTTLKEIEQKHTPEPWMHLNGEHTIWTRLNDGCRGMPIARVNTVMPQDQANAARIVACVNSLAGLDDPASALKAAREALALTADAAFRIDPPADSRLGMAWEAVDKALRLLTPKLGAE